MCSFDLYLHRFLMKLAVVDGEIINEERSFICDISDHSDELYRLKKGYRRFLRQLSVETVCANADEMLAPADFEMFFAFLGDCNSIDAASIVE